MYTILQVTSAIVEKTLNVVNMKDIYIHLASVEVYQTFMYLVMIFVL